MVSPRPHVFLHASNISRSFDSRDVWTNLSFSAAGGARLAVTGSNGSGKSTLLRCIAGTLKPDRGSVTVDGSLAGSVEARNLTGVAAALDRAFYLRLTGRDNLLIFSRLRNPDRRSSVEQVERLVDELEIEHIAAERADRCSTGMLQQLNFARALLGNPKLLLLDEPTRSLDEDARSKLWGALDRRSDVCVVIATHSSQDAERCDGQLVLDQHATEA